jgi:hypothetical protein
MDEYPSDPSTKTFFLHFDIRYRFKYAVRNSQRIRYAGVYIESVCPLGSWYGQIKYSIHYK